MEKMEVVEAEINILELPLEVLEKIISYVPDQFTVAQTCKRFYEISCSIKRYKLVVRNDYEVKNNFKSILRSKRRVCKIKVLDTKLTHFEKVFKKFRKSVTELAFYVLSMDISTFNFLPNLSHIKLCDVGLKGNLTKNFKLKLPHLRVLILEECNEIFLDVFDALPDDVLVDLTLDRMYPKDGEKSRVFFKNQRKIKKLKLDFCQVALDYSQLKLEELTCLYTKVDISGQNELRKLYANKVNNDFFQMICNELGAIEDLKLELKNPVNFTRLHVLKKLKKLDVEDCEEFNDFQVRSQSLEKIRYRMKVASDILLDCPNIRELDLEVFASLNINNILLNFPKLERLELLVEEFRDVDENIPQFEHEHLKYFSITNHIENYDFKQALSDMMKCTNLKAVSINKGDLQTLRDFLTKQTNVKFLKITENEFNQEFFLKLENISGCLDGIIVETYSRDTEHLKKVQKKLRKKLRNTMPFDELSEWSEDENFNLILKKNKNIDVRKQFFL